MAGRAAARKLVESIAKEHGFVDDATWKKLEQLDPELRRQFEEAMMRKDSLIGSSAITLAKNLYSSKARFVYELLQNAEDNQYTRARAQGQSRYLSFAAFRDRVVLECNEDGFTTENLTAICNIGKSSKTGAQGYIGEKGIGFKSVFMVAYKAWIQSGDFSFSFTHRKNGSGMGMISPVWEDGEDDTSPPPGVTRITLFLHEEGDFDTRKKRHDDIRQQLEGLQETILLFMKNLQKIDISIYDSDEELTLSRTCLIERKTASHAITRTRTVEYGEEEEDEKHFHTTVHTATNLAKNENRTYTDFEERTKAFSKSEVVVAFPLENGGTAPLLENQWLYAFLPMRQMGFKVFICHLRCNCKGA
jgi:HSP90 family molecular chaperone